MKNQQGGFKIQALYFVRLSFHVDVNECTVHKPCKNGGTCINSVGGYSCKCPNNFKGKHCDEGTFMYCLDLAQGWFCYRVLHMQDKQWQLLKVIQLSRESKPSRLLLDTVRRRQLLKSFGFLFSYFQDVDECSDIKPCKNGAKCANTVGSYKCTCVGGWFTGKHCDEGKNLGNQALKKEN